MPAFPRLWPLVVLRSFLGPHVPAAQRVELPLRLHVPAEAEALGDAESRRLQGRPTRHKIELSNYDNMQYQLEAEMGTPCDDASPRQRLVLVPDTGSADFWVPAENCSHCPKSRGAFRINESCSAVQIGDRVQFHYEDGTTASGGTFRDNVKLGDLVVQAQWLAQVDNVTSTSVIRSDGILGLAHHQVEDRGGVRGKAFMATLFEQHTHLPKMFSFHMAGNSESPSRLIFGEPDLRAHAKDSEFMYSNNYWMSTTGLWMSSVWSMGWSGTSVQATFQDHGVVGSPALVDSGSSMIVLSTDIYNFLVPKLTWRLQNCHGLGATAKEVVLCDCPDDNAMADMPDLVINMVDQNNQQFTLCMSPDEYILQSIPINGLTQCVIALQKGGDTMPTPIIFGMVFMRSFYVNFDLGNKRIGFARSIQSPLPAGAKCAVKVSAEEVMARHTTWIVAGIFCLSSASFALFVLFKPGGCCTAMLCEPPRKIKRVRIQPPSPQK